MEHEHPASMTARAVKKALPDRAIVTKDARVMLNTATSMFTLYLTTIAHDVSTKNKRSTITLKDVIGALREAELEHMIEPIEQCLQDTKSAEARKRARKDAQKAMEAGNEASDARVASAPELVEATEDVPIETDADLDGDHTVDEEEEDEPVEDEEMAEEELAAAAADEQVEAAVAEAAELQVAEPESSVQHVATVDDALTEGTQTEDVTMDDDVETAAVVNDAQEG